MQKSVLFVMWHILEQKKPAFPAKHCIFIGICFTVYTHFGTYFIMLESNILVSEIIITIVSTCYVLKHVYIRFLAVYH